MGKSEVSATESWGLLGPTWLEKQRRVRSLGVGAAVREFNELAVPGLGGIWFGRQLCLATLGLAVAERTPEGPRRPQNTEVANAIEALACWLDFQDSNFEQDAKLRGRNKLRQCESFPTFQEARQRRFYVTQPMRMATVQPLRALGFAAGASERFNAYTCTDEGRALAEAGCDGLRPRNRDVVEHLTRWTRGDAKIASPLLHRAISPTAELPRVAAELIRERLVAGGTAEAKRRSDVLEWMAARRAGLPTTPTWERRPAALTAAHWSDLRVGAQFFQARDLALQILDKIEAHVALQANGRVGLTKNVLKPLVGDLFDELRACASAFIALGHDPTTGRLATAFCSALTVDIAACLIVLVDRDGVGLRRIGQDAVPGPAFRGRQVGSREGDDAGENSVEDEGPDFDDTNSPLPTGISSRVRRLEVLDLDLRAGMSQTPSRAPRAGAAT